MQLPVVSDKNPVQACGSFGAPPGLGLGVHSRRPRPDPQHLTPAAVITDAKGTAWSCDLQHVRLPGFHSVYRREIRLTPQRGGPG